MRTWFPLLITGHNKKSNQCNIRWGGQSKLLEAQTHQQYSNNHLILTYTKQVRLLAWQLLFLQYDNQNSLS